MSMVRKDDGPAGVASTGAVAANANPANWLTVSIGVVGGSQLGTFDFEGWRTFRQWVEMSDPGFATAINPLR